MRLSENSSSVKDILYRIRYFHREKRSPRILMYHSVSDDASKDWGPWKYAVTPSRFEKQISILSDAHTVCSLDKIIRYVTSGVSIDPSTVALTFDDGYADFCTNALPILQKYNVPATVFISTSMINKNYPPFEQRLARGLMARDQLEIRINQERLEFDLRQKSRVIEAYEQIRSELKFASFEQRRSVLNSVQDSESPGSEMVSTGEIKKLAKHRLVTIGSHGHRHLPLTTLRESDIAENIRASQSALCDLIGENIRYFSYPYGSVNNSVRRAVEQNEFEAGLTTSPRSIQPRDWTNPFTLPRVDAATKFDRIV